MDEDCRRRVIYRLLLGVLVLVVTLALPLTVGPITLPVRVIAVDGWVVDLLVPLGLLVEVLVLFVLLVVAVAIVVEDVLFALTRYGRSNKHIVSTYFIPQDFSPQPSEHVDFVYGNVVDTVLVCNGELPADVNW